MDRLTGESMTQNGIWMQAVYALGFCIPGANKIEKECSVCLSATKKRIKVGIEGRSNVLWFLCPAEVH